MVQAKRYLASVLQPSYCLALLAIMLLVFGWLIKVYARE